MCAVGTPRLRRTMLRLAPTAGHRCLGACIARRDKARVNVSLKSRIVAIKEYPEQAIISHQ
jgi:hypothetical protein